MSRSLTVPSQPGTDLRNTKSTLASSPPKAVLPPQKTSQQMNADASARQANGQGARSRLMLKGATQSPIAPLEERRELVLTKLQKQFVATHGDNTARAALVAKYATTMLADVLHDVKNFSEKAAGERALTPNEQNSIGLISKAIPFMGESALDETVERAKDLSQKMLATLHNSRPSSPTFNHALMVHTLVQGWLEDIGAQRV